MIATGLKHAHPAGLKPVLPEGIEGERPPPTILTLVETLVERVYRVDHQRLHSRQRGTADVALARQVAMYLAHVACGIGLADVGRAFGRDRTTVSHACGVVEEHRDDPAFDATLELLFGILRHMTSISHVTTTDH